MTEPTAIPPVSGAGVDATSRALALPRPSSRRGWRDPGLAPRLEGTRFREVRWFAEIDSTNRYLLDEAGAGAPAGLVAVADVQTAGRGRLGRRWEAPRGASLLVSVLLRPSLEVGRLHLATVAAGVAAAQAVRGLAGIHATLKWPNDLVVADRKLAGVLAESLPGPALVVGMGLNVSWESFPPELADTATACNLENDSDVAIADLLVAWLRELDLLLHSLASDGGAALRGAYMALSATVGRRVRVELAERFFEGDAVGIDDDGHLIVQRGDGIRETVAAGDVVSLRPR